MAKPWEEHRRTITKLYIQEGRTLEDVRAIMRNKHNFEASIRSYRQHLDIWEIGKYNCKKRQQRQQRRRQLRDRMTLPAPLHTPPTCQGSSETSNPGYSQMPSYASLDSPKHLALPPIHRTQHELWRNFDGHRLLVSQSSSISETRIKTEVEGVGTSCKDVLMCPSAARHPPQGVLQSNPNSRFPSGHLHVQPPPSSMPPGGHCLDNYYRVSASYVPPFSRHSEMISDLRAPNIPVLRGGGGRQALVSLPVGFHQGVASG